MSAEDKLEEIRHLLTNADDLGLDGLALLDSIRSAVVDSLTLEMLDSAVDLVDPNESCAGCWFSRSFDVLRCHRNPPSAADETWPEVRPEHWCGEFKPLLTARRGGSQND